MEFRIFAAVYHRSQEQAGGEEAGGNPEDGGLQVPSAHQRIGEPVRQRNAEETLAFHGVVRSEAAEQNLHDKQRHGQEHIFAQRALRRRELHFADRIGIRQLRLAFVFVQERPAPHQEADTGQQEYDTGHRPHHVFRGRHVVNQRFVRPVVGVGGVVVRAVGSSSPRRPEEEIGQALAAGFIRQRVIFHREVFASFLHRRIVAVQRDVVRGNRFDGFDAGVAQHHFAVGAHAAAVAVFFRERGFQRSLLVGIELVKHLAVLLLRTDVQPGHQFTVQPVGRPVGRLVSAVAENRAQLHTAGTLPGRLAGQHVVFADYGFAVG